MTLALDSNVIIAALSAKEAHSQVAQQIMRGVVAGEYAAFASSIAYGEVFAVASSNQAGRLELAVFFAELKHFETLAADDEICTYAGELRRKYGQALKLPDAIHLATGILHGADLFVTNDGPFAKFAGKLLPTKTLTEW